MSRNEKQLKEIIKTLGGTCNEGDNTTCELLGRVNEGLKNVLGSGLKLVESVDVSEPVLKGGQTLAYKLNKNEYEANKTYLVAYTSSGYGSSLTTIVKLNENGNGEGFGTIPYDAGGTGYGTIGISREGANGSKISFILVEDFTPVDELSFINIYELCLVSGEGESPVKVIDVSTLEVDGDDMAYLDLSQKGKYLLTINENADQDFRIEITFGWMSNNIDFGKQLRLYPPSSSCSFHDFDVACGSRNTVCKIWIYPNSISSTYPVYFEVTNDRVDGYKSYEN